MKNVAHLSWRIDVFVMGGRVKIFYKIWLVVPLMAIWGCASVLEGGSANQLPLVKVSVPSKRADTERADLGGSQNQTRKTDDFGVEYIDGTGQFVRTSPAISPIRQGEGDSVSLTFRNADIRSIIRAVLLDTLGLPYILDSRVQGQATLETSGAIQKDMLKDALEALLRTQGYAMVVGSDGLNILPVSDAPRSVSKYNYNSPASVELPGFGVHIVPLKFTAAREMKSLIEPFAPNGGVLRADSARNILILAGTSQELTTMLRTIETFDVNWMSEMSFAIYSLKYADAEGIVNELKKIFDTPGTPTNELVRFIPIPRINKFVAIAPQKSMLKTVETWVGKLDLGESSPGRRIYVYSVNNGRAVDVAGTLNSILGLGFSDPSRATSTNARANNSNRTNQLQRAGNARGNRNGQSDLGQLGQTGLRIVPNEESNSVLVFATPAEFGIIETALKQIDVAPRQVFIEATLAEVTLTDELRYGIQWGFNFGDNTVSLGKSNTPSSEFPGFSWSYSNGSSASAVLNALESITDVQVISSPKLMVLNNHPATIQVGDEVPVPVASSVSTTDSNAPTVNTIQYRTTGVILNVTPRINEGGLVMLDVEQEVSNVVQTASSGIDAPTIQQRRITSTVAVKDGSTIALGGLIRRSISNVKSGIPILKDIPLLGAAFRDTDVVERRSELIILITPRIVSDTAGQREVMDYLQNEFRALLTPPDNADAGE